MITRVAIVGGMFLAMLFVGAFASAELPLTIEDMQAMRKERKRPFEILRAAEERGVDIAFDAKTEKSLRRIGIRGTLLQQLKEIADRDAPDEPAELGPQQRRNEAIKKHGKDLLPDPETDEAEETGTPTSAPHPEQAAKLAEIDKQFRQIIKKSALEIELHNTKHARLIGEPEFIRQILPSVQRWEDLAAKRFADPIPGSIDRRGVNIVLLSSDYQFRRWVTASFEVYKTSGINFNDPKAQQRALKSKAFFFRGTFNANVADMPGDSVRHRAVFGVAHLGILQLTNDKVPDAIATGFGNLAETMVFGDQFITVQSGYTDREIKKEATTWPERVQMQFKLNKIGSIQNVLVYSTGSMQLPQYALGWSLTSLLAKEEKEFADWIVRLRDHEDSYEALQKSYSMDDADLMKRWRRVVRSQR